MKRWIGTLAPVASDQYLVSITSGTYLTADVLALCDYELLHTYMRVSTLGTFIVNRHCTVGVRAGLASRN